jgi:hypothetical protein
LSYIYGVECGLNLSLLSGSEIFFYNALGTQSGTISTPNLTENLEYDSNTGHTFKIANTDVMTMNATTLTYNGTGGIVFNSGAGTDLLPPFPPYLPPALTHLQRRPSNPLRRVNNRRTRKARR